VLIDEAAFNAAGWKSATSTPFGEIGVRGLLMAGVSDKDAVRAAAGWGGDRAYLFEKAGSAPLFVWKTVWDKATDAEEFFDAYNSLRRRRSTEVRGSTSTENVEQASWRDGGRLTLVRRSGDTVIVIRGSEADAGAVLELTQR
jgi:hypothetical protein